MGGPAFLVCHSLGGLVGLQVRLRAARMSCAAWPSGLRLQCRLSDPAPISTTRHPSGRTAGSRASLRPGPDGRQPPAGPPQQGGPPAVGARGLGGAAAPRHACRSHRNRLAPLRSAPLASALACAACSTLRLLCARPVAVQATCYGGGWPRPAACGRCCAGPTAATRAPWTTSSCRQCTRYRQGLCDSATAGCFARARLAVRPSGLRSTRSVQGICAEGAAPAIIVQPALRPGAHDVFFDVIAYTGGPTPEDLLPQVLRLLREAYLH